MRIRITGTGSETIPQDHVQDRDQGVDPDEKSVFQDVEIIAAIGIIAEGGGITTVTVVAMSEIIDDTTKVVKPGNLATTKQILFQWKILLRSSLHRYHRLHHNNSINDIKSLKRRCPTQCLRSLWRLPYQWLLKAMDHLS